MKSIFRYLTAEFNGAWIQAFHRSEERNIADIKELYSYMARMKFKLEDEDILDGESPIRESDIVGIGKIAGLFIPYISAESNLGSILFTDSKVVNGKQYSERGLFNMHNERFDFYRTDEGSYQTDLTSLASSKLRSSFVPDGAPVLGYIAEGTNLFDEAGNIIPSAILATPPVDRAYTPYYGEKYLFLAEVFLIKSFVDISTYKKLVESFQRIRYNGASIKELAYLTETLLEDYVYDVRFEPYQYAVKMVYKRNDSSSMSGKIKRFYIWSLLLSLKFKQIYAVEE